MAILYAVIAWLIMQVAQNLIELGNLEPYYGRYVLIALAVGFPIALILSWFLELTPEGLKVEKNIEAAESTAHITGRPDIQFCIQGSGQRHPGDCQCSGRGTYS